MKPRTITVAGSLLLHGLLAGAAIWYAGLPKAKKPHTVAVMGQQKKKEDVPKPPPPPPKPRPASKTIDPMPAPLARPEAPPPPKSSAPPRMAGEMTNGNGGRAQVGDTHGEPSGAGRPPAKPVKEPVAKKQLSDEDACTEAPGKPSPLNRPSEIEYTQQARADGIEGRLVLKIIVGVDGTVTDVVVVHSVDPSLDAAAIATVKAWVFKPALRCGKPSGGGIYMVAQRFELGD